MYWEGGEVIIMIADDTPKKVAQISNGKPGLPSLTVDPNGRFIVIWNQGIRGYNEVYVSSLEVQK